MSDLAVLGRWILFAGIGLMVLGAALWLAGRAGLPLGRLPGDLRFETGGVTCVVPIATSILISVILTVLLNLIARYLTK